MLDASPVARVDQMPAEEFEGRVVVVHNVVAPYRHPLFETLFRKVGLTVYYCSTKEDFRKWELWPRRYEYGYKILPRFQLGMIGLNPSLVRELVATRPRVVIIGGYTDPSAWLAFLVARMLRASVIYWTEGVKEPRGVVSFVTRPVRFLFAVCSSAVIVPGKLSKEYVVKTGATPSKVFVAPNAIDNDLFVNEASRFSGSKDKLKSSMDLAGKTVLLYVGQFIERKGVLHLLQTYAKLKERYPQIALILVGSGRLLPTMSTILSESSVRDVRIVPNGLGTRELVKMYSTADIFVFPTMEDIWGLVINEAMCCGLPIVATSASQAAVQMVSPGINGYIVKEGSEGLYIMLERLVSDRGSREQMGEKSKELVVSRFGVADMAEGFMSAIEHCTASK